MRPITFQDGETALMGACALGHVEVVKDLLDADPKADVNAKDNVSLLCNYRAIAIIYLYCKFICPTCFQDGGTALMIACDRGHVEVVKALLDFEPKADIEAKMNVGVLSMHL